MSAAYLIIGGNLGNKVKFLEEARFEIEKISKGEIVYSSIYESEPWGFDTDKWFLNQVIRVETDLSPEDLLKRVLEIEDFLGRDRNATIDENKKVAREYSSRVVDIDILFYDDLVYKSESLIIPHPRIHLRKFVLVPLNEIAPNKIHPKINKKIGTLLDECADCSIVKLYNK